MSAAFLRKYNTATHIYIPMIKRAVVDFAVGADWTPATGDVKVSIDGAAVANIGTLPVAITSGNTAFWDFVFTGGETTGKKISVVIADAATKAVEDNMFVIETYGHASAEYQWDMSLANLPANVTQLLGTAWLTPGTAGTPDVNTKLIGGTSQTGLDLGINWTAARAAHLDADISSRMATFSLPTNFSSLAITAGGIAKADIQTILTTAVTEGGAGRLAAAFIKLFDIAVPVLTSASVNQTGDSYARIGAGGASLNAIPGVTVAAGGIDSTAFTTAALNAIADALLDRNMATGADTGSNVTRTVRQALRSGRNKVDTTVGKVYKEDDSTESWSFAVTTAAGNPITIVDPT